MRIQKLSLIVACLSLALSAAAQQLILTPLPGSSDPNGVYNAESVGSLSEVFTVNQTVLVYSVGYWDELQNGFHGESGGFEEMKVALFYANGPHSGQIVSGSEIDFTGTEGSLTGDVLQYGQYRIASLASPVQLTAGGQYAIVTYGFTDADPFFDGRTGPAAAFDTLGGALTFNDAVADSTETAFELPSGGTTYSDARWLTGTFTALVLPPTPSITSALTATGATGTAFSYTITATSTPTSFNAVGLPTGLTVNTATGVIGGTPTATGSTSVTISATNPGGTATAALNVIVVLGPPSITSSLTANGATNNNFSYTITATNTPTSYSASGLPGGLNLNAATGAITGTPTVAGSSTVTISANNAAGHGSAVLNLIIIADPVIVTQPISQTIPAGQPVAMSVNASGVSTLAYQWFKNGAPIPGATSSTLGIDNPQTSDSGSYSVTVADLASVVTSSAAVLTVLDTPIINAALTAPGYVGVSFQYTFATTSMPTNVIVSGLPAGLVLNSSAQSITGIPSNTGTYTVTLTAINAAGTGTPFSFTLTVGTAPYGFSVLAGGQAGSLDGDGQAAEFSAPSGLAIDSAGNLYVADTGNSTIRKVTPSGTVTTLAGAAGESGALDGVGGLARFSSPEGITVDSSGNIFVADTGNDTIRMIAPDGTTSTLAGSVGVPGTKDGNRNGASFNHPTGIAVDGTGNLFVGDTGNSTIRKITPQGTVSTLAGLATITGNTDSVGIGARFNLPTGVTLDGTGQIYVADTGNLSVRKITPAGAVSTFMIDTAYLAGESGYYSSTNQAIFNGISVDGLGNVYCDFGPLSVDELTETFVVSDVFEISPSGLVSTLQESQAIKSVYSQTFSGMANIVTGVAASNSGILYVTVNGAIMEGTLASGPFISTQPASQIVNEGQNVTLLVTTAGSPTLTYQWEKNGLALSGATSSSLMLNEVQASDAASYSVVVSTAYGVVTSAQANLAVLTTEPQNQAVAAGAAVSFSVAVGNAKNPRYQWNFDEAPIPGATTAVYSISAATLANTGSYTVNVSDGAESAISSGAVLAVRTPGAPTIILQPQSQTMAAGSTVVLSIPPNGLGPNISMPASTERPQATSSISYQWYFDGVAVPGGTSGTLVISDADAADAGSYSCLVSNSAGSALTNAATLTVVTTSNPGHLTNLSLLTDIQTSLTLGFVVGGGGTSGGENLLIRAIGPSIGPDTPFNVPGVMGDPTLAVQQQTPSMAIAGNAGWGQTANNATAVQAADAATGAFALTNTASLDSAIVLNLVPVAGGYSAIIAGNSGDSGWAIGEIYDDTTAYTVTDTRLVNLSCMTQIGNGGTLDAGFVIGGTTSETVLVRVAGPAINAIFGISGVMPDPQLQISPLGSAASILAANAGWNANPEVTLFASTVGAYPWTNSPIGADSAAVVTLPPGAYTVQVSGVSGDGGTVLVEIYEVP